jgi:hypothetical protein
MSILELARTTPVNPPIVNRNTNPVAQRREGEKFNWQPCNVPNHLNTLIPVGTAIIIVAAVK